MAGDAAGGETHGKLGGSKQEDPPAPCVFDVPSRARSCVSDFLRRAAHYCCYRVGTYRGAWAGSVWGWSMITRQRQKHSRELIQIQQSWTGGQPASQPATGPGSTVTGQLANANCKRVGSRGLELTEAVVGKSSAWRSSIAASGATHDASAAIAVSPLAPRPPSMHPTPTQPQSQSKRAPLSPLHTCGRRSLHGGAETRVDSLVRRSTHPAQ